MRTSLASASCATSPVGAWLTIASAVACRAACDVACATIASTTHERAILRVMTPRARTDHGRQGVQPREETGPMHRFGVTLSTFRIA